jgi:hypothetical protein
VIGKSGIVCEGDSVCEDTFNDGFVAYAFPDRFDIKNSSFEVQLVKGPEQPLADCHAYAVGSFSASGFSPAQNESFILGGLKNITCSEPEEPYFVAIIMLVILAVVLIAALLTFRLCRPNREVYQSDDEKERRVRRDERSAEGPMPYTERSAALLPIAD